MLKLLPYQYLYNPPPFCAKCNVLEMGCTNCDAIKVWDCF